METGNNTVRKRASLNKNLRIQGKPYSTARGKQKPGKATPPADVTCKCKYKCKQLTKEAKEMLFLELYKLSDEQQGTYLMNRVEIIPVSRRRQGTYDEPSKSKRQSTMIYTVPSGCGLVQVCAKTFKEIFSLSNSKLQTLNHKKKLGNIAYNDKRGKNPSSHKHAIKFTEEDCSLVREHISSFPRQESHYGRSKSSKEYLSSDLNYSRMYRAFKVAFPQSKVSYRYYQRVFNKYFRKLAFGIPKTDTCRVCDRYNAKIKVANTAAEQFPLRSQLTLHQRKAAKSYNLMTKSMNESQLPQSNVFCISMDLQQVLFCPTLTHNNMFYMRQLSNYNLCFHVGDSGISYMCMWHEGISGRGGNEISSCFLKILQSKFSEKKKLEVWCDNCVGQNKNRMLVLAVIYLVAKGYFESIDIKFLTSGHSYMPCDRDFGLIEKRKRKCKAMIPKEIQEVVRSTRTDSSFKVIEMQKEDFYDIGAAADLYINLKFKITKISWLRVSNENLPKILTRQAFNELEDWSIHSVFKKGKSHQHIAKLDKLPALNFTNKITNEKKKDLTSMLDYMDEKYHDFYKNLCK